MGKLLVIGFTVFAAYYVSIHASDKSIFTVGVAVMAFLSSLLRSIPYIADLETMRAEAKTINRMHELSLFSWNFFLIYVFTLPVIIFAMFVFNKYPINIDIATSVNVLEWGFIDHVKNSFTQLIWLIIALLIEVFIIGILLKWVHCTGLDEEYSNVKDNIKSKYVILSLVILSLTLVSGIWGYIAHGA
ncbi:hypothetical protein MNBD_BACTEROID05-375 [hydrothermal vent metagenome]|uniref:Uncharacterized protein n=1 Tax=hydrothermal vent metagenome TaxID=652676 RepID=A0A3B0U023_9ZZZZ